jgi:hypothetical protein
MNRNHFQLTATLYLAASIITILLIAYYLINHTSTTEPANECLNILPFKEVQTGDEVLFCNKVFLIENDIISEDEEILFFHAKGYQSILDAGIVLTRNRVVHYLQNQRREITKVSLPLSEINHIEQVASGSNENLNMYRLQTNWPRATGQRLLITLPISNDRDRQFINLIHSINQE